MTSNGTHTLAHVRARTRMHFILVVFILVNLRKRKENSGSLAYSHTSSPAVFLTSGVLLYLSLSSKAGVKLFPGNSCLACIL